MTFSKRVERSSFGDSECERLYPDHRWFYTALFTVGWVYAMISSSCTLLPLKIKLWQIKYENLKLKKQLLRIKRDIEFMQNLKGKI